MHVLWFFLQPSQRVTTQRASCSLFAVVTVRISSAGNRVLWALQGATRRVAFSRGACAASHRIASLVLLDYKHVRASACAHESGDARVDTAAIKNTQDGTRTQRRVGRRLDASPRTLDSSRVAP